MAVALKRELGLLAVFCTATGAMISSGLFILPGLAHAKAGPAVIVSYLLAGLLAMTGMLSQAELVSAKRIYPRFKSFESIKLRSGERRITSMLQSITNNKMLKRSMKVHIHMRALRVIISHSLMIPILI